MADGRASPVHTPPAHHDPGRMASCRMPSATDSRETRSQFSSAAFRAFTGCDRT